MKIWSGQSGECISKTLHYQSTRPVEIESLFLAFNLHVDLDLERKYRSLMYGVGSRSTMVCGVHVRGTRQCRST